MTINRRDLDNFITGHDGEDQFKEADDVPYIVFENGSVIQGNPNGNRLKGRKGDVLWMPDEDQ